MFIFYHPICHSFFLFAYFCSCMKTLHFCLFRRHFGITSTRTRLLDPLLSSRRSIAWRPQWMRSVLSQQRSPRQLRLIARISLVLPGGLTFISGYATLISIQIFNFIYISGHLCPALDSNLTRVDMIPSETLQLKKFTWHCETDQSALISW